MANPLLCSAFGNKVALFALLGIARLSPFALGGEARWQSTAGNIR